MIPPTPGSSFWRPPAPTPRPPVPSLLRLMWRREKDLLSLLPDLAYRELSLIHI